MPDEPNKALALKIVKAIADSGMQKKDIADALGVSKQSISGWEKTGRISKQNLSGLSELLKIDLKWFYSGEDEPRGYSEVKSTMNETNSNEAPQKFLRQPISLINRSISHDTVTTLEQLLVDAKDGKLIGIAFAAAYAGQDRGFFVDVTGECYRNPVFARGMVACLDDMLRSMLAS